MSCPLCNSTDTSQLKDWLCSDIQINYDLYNINVMDILPEHILELECNDCGLIFFQAEEGSEEFYNRLMINEWYYQDDKSEFNITSKYITRHDSVLEIGSGKGHYLTHINPKLYQGLEFNNTAVKLANQLGRNVINQSIVEHKGNYSIVIAHQVLEHVKDTNMFIESCIDKLLPDGLLILTVPSEDGIMGQLPNFCLNQPPHHLTKWKDYTLYKLADMFGLELVDLIHEPADNEYQLSLLDTLYQGYGHTVVVVYRKV